VIAMGTKIDAWMTRHPSLKEGKLPVGV